MSSESKHNGDDFCFLIANIDQYTSVIYSTFIRNFHTHTYTQTQTQVGTQKQSVKEYMFVLWLCFLI